MSSTYLQTFSLVHHKRDIIVDLYSTANNPKGEWIRLESKHNLPLDPVDYFYHIPSQTVYLFTLVEDNKGKLEIMQDHRLSLYVKGYIEGQLYKLTKETDE